MGSPKLDEPRRSKDDISAGGGKEGSFRLRFMATTLRRLADSGELGVLAEFGWRASWFWKSAFMLAVARSDMDAGRIGGEVGRLLRSGAIVNVQYEMKLYRLSWWRLEELGGLDPDGLRMMIRLSWWW